MRGQAVIRLGTRDLGSRCPTMPASVDPRVNACEESRASVEVRLSSTEQVPAKNGSTYFSGDWLCSLGKVLK